VFSRCILCCKDTLGNVNWVVPFADLRIGIPARPESTNDSAAVRVESLLLVR
jgi:hypothetical protein